MSWDAECVMVIPGSAGAGAGPEAGADVGRGSEAGADVGRGSEADAAGAGGEPAPSGAAGACPKPWTSSGTGVVGTVVPPPSGGVTTASTWRPSTTCQCSGASPGLATVTVRVSVPPRVTTGSSRSGSTVRRGTGSVPVPRSVTASGLVRASLVTVTVAIAGPSTVGLKVESSVQLAPAPRVNAAAPQVPPAAANGALGAVTPETARSLVPVLASVRLSGPAVEPVATSPESSGPGEVVSSRGPYTPRYQLATPPVAVNHPPAYSFSGCGPAPSRSAVSSAVTQS